jgi:bilin biosynthesis protein
MKSTILAITLGLVLAGCHTSPSSSTATPVATPAPVAIPVRTPAAELIDQTADASLREMARKELVGRGAEIVPDLIAKRSHPDSHVRWEIANLLGTIADARGKETLVLFVLEETHPHVRWRSLWALSRVTTTAEAVAALRDGLASGEANVRWQAALALSFFGSNEGVEILHEGTRSPDPFRRWEAINALGRTHNDGTLAVLRAAMESPSERDRNEAVLSIGQIGGEVAVGLLHEALTDESADVRWRAAMSLGRAGTEASLRPLQRLVEEDSDNQVREQAAKALERLRKKLSR